MPNFDLCFASNLHTWDRHSVFLWRGPMFPGSWSQQLVWSMRSQASEQPAIHQTLQGQKDSNCWLLLLEAPVYCPWKVLERKARMGSMFTRVNGPGEMSMSKTWPCVQSAWVTNLESMIVMNIRIEEKLTPMCTSQERDIDEHWRRGEEKRRYIYLVI